MRYRYSIAGQMASNIITEMTQLLWAIGRAVFKVLVPNDSNKTKQQIWLTTNCDNTSLIAIQKLKSKLLHTSIVSRFKFLLLFLLVQGVGEVSAQVDPRGFNFNFPLNDGIKPTSLIIQNSAKANNGAQLIQPTGIGKNDGWLHLSPGSATNFSPVGWAYIDQAFAPPIGLVGEFEYRSYGQPEIGDGLSVFLFDGQINTTSFTPGSPGGGLMYARNVAYTSSNQWQALSGGYMGIGLDVLGNFGNNGETTSGISGGIAPNALSIRGMNTGVNDNTNTKYIAGTAINLGGTSAAANGITAVGLTNTIEVCCPFPTPALNPDLANIYYRRVRFYLLPINLPAADAQGFTSGNVDMAVTVELQAKKDGPFYPLIQNQALNQSIYVSNNPADPNYSLAKTFKIGFGAAIGNGARASHDIRYLKVSAPMNLKTSSVVDLNNANVGNQLNYITTLSNLGFNGILTTAGTFSISTTGVDIINPAAIVTNAQKSDLNISITYDSNPSPGRYIYKITNLAPNASITLTYAGTISATVAGAQAIVTAQIVPPTGFGNTDVNEGRSTATTNVSNLVFPILNTPTPNPATVNSGNAFTTNLSLSNASSFNNVYYLWTAMPSTDVTGASGQVTKNVGISSINQTLVKATPGSGLVTYMVTPYGDRLVGGGTDIAGTAQQFTVNVNSGWVPPTDLPILNVPAPFVINSGSMFSTNLSLTNADKFTNVEYTWVTTASPGITGATDQVGWGSGVINQVLLNSGTTQGTVTYTVTPRGRRIADNTLVTGAQQQVVVTVNSGRITLSFVDAIGTAIANVNGGSDAYLKASLPTGVFAPAGGLVVNVSRSGGSTAVGPTNYTGLVSSITIPAGQNTTSTKAFTAQNAGVIGGSTILTLSGLASTGYTLGPNPTITINDNSGSIPSNSVITISAGSVQAGSPIPLRASLPTGITTASKLSIVVTPSPAFPANYTVDGVMVTGGQFTVSIPAGSNSVNFVVGTVNDPSSFVDKAFSLPGSATTSGFTVVAGALTVTNANTIPVTLSFTDSSGNAITNVSGGADAYLQASLPAGVTAPAGGVAVQLARSTGSTAVGAVNYTGLIGAITISSGQSAALAKAFTAQNANVIAGTTVLTLAGVATTGYTASSSPTIIINDVTGNTAANKVITISSGTINETGIITLQASLPSGIKTATPLTITITPSPAFPAPGYSVNNGSAITTAPFNVVIGPMTNSAIIKIATSDDGQMGDNVFLLSGSVTDPSFSVLSGTLTVTNSSVIKLRVDNSVLPKGAQLVGSALTYTTTISNDGFVGIQSYTLLIQTSGVDIDYTKVLTGLQKSAGVGSIVYDSSSSIPSSNIYAYAINTFPAGSNIVLTYGGTVNSIASSAINRASISLPGSLVNSDPSISVVQTLIRPVLTQPLSNSTTCSGVAMNIGFSAIPSAFTSYTWSRTSNGSVSGPLTGTGTILNDVLTNSSSSISQTVTYTITPQIVTTSVNSVGVSGGITTCYGTPKSFSVTIKPSNVTSVASSSLINVVATNENGYLVLTPSAAGIVNPTFKWYSSLGGTQGSINDGTVDPISGVRRILIAPPLDIGQRYDYYITVAGDNSCESAIGTNYVTISQVVTITFVDSSGMAITSVNGGSPGDYAYLRASLPVGVTAQSGPVTITVVRSALSSTAMLGTDYTGSLPVIVIPQGANLSALVAAFTATNRGVIGGSTSLTIASSISPSYYYANPTSIRIVDTSGDSAASRIITLGSALVAESLSTTLTAYLPTLANGATVTTATPLTVTITSNTPFPLGYSISTSLGVQSVGGNSSFNVVIPAGANGVGYTVQTASDAIYVDRVFTLGGAASTTSGQAFTVVPGTLTVINTDIPTDDAKIYINSSTIAGGSVGIIKATLLKVNPNNDITVVVGAAAPGFPVGYSVNGTATFTIVIPRGATYGTAAVNTVANASTYNYQLTGIASDVAAKAYYVYPGSLTVTGTSVTDDQKVYISSSTISGGSVGSIRASLQQVNMSNDVTVVLHADSPGFLSSYSISGTSTFTITIPKGSLYGTATVSTMADVVTYNYTIGGTASAGSSKAYYVYSGNLIVTGADVSDDSKIYLSSSTIAGGSVATIKATLLTANTSNDIKVVIRADAPGFASGYSVVGTNSFTITIPKGSMYGSVSISTISTISTYNYLLNGSASDTTTKPYYVYSGSLTVTSSSVPDDQKVSISSHTIEGGSTAFIKASLLKVNSSADVTVTVRADAPGFIAGYNPAGVIPFSITIPKGSLYGTAPVSTIADPNVYNYTLNGTASDGRSKAYYVYSGNLIVTGSNVGNNQKVYISSSTIAGGTQATIKASLVQINSSSDVTVVVRADTPGFLSTYSVTGINPITITIPKGSLYGTASVNTTSNSNTYNYMLNGLASDGSSKLYYVYSGNLIVTGTNITNDQKVYISTRTIVGGNVGTVQASLLQVNTDSDIVVTVQADNQGFLPGYSPSGTTPFTITIPKGSLYGTATVNTIANANTYNYSIGGMATDGTTKNYYVYSGSLIVLGQTISLNNIVTITERTVLEGVSIDMLASMPTAPSSNVTVVVTPGPSFPTSYKVKVNGTYVSISNFNVTIPSGQTSTIFTVETADDGLSASRSFNLNGTTTTPGVYIVSGNLKVLDKSEQSPVSITLRASSATICGGNPIDLNNYVIGVNPVISPAVYQYYSRYGGESMVPLGTVSRGATYTIYAINPNTGEVGATSIQVVIANGQVPSMSVTPSITYYYPIAIDLTYPNLITSSSSNIYAYKYYTDALGTIEVPDPKNVTISGEQTFYIQGISLEGCTSLLQPLLVKQGSDLYTTMSASSPTLKEGSSGFFVLKLLTTDGSIPTLQQDQAFTITPDASRNEATPLDYTIASRSLSVTAIIPKGQSSVSIPVKALNDRILYDNTRLSIDASTSALGSTSAELEIIDSTSDDPNNRIIILEDGTIYYEDEITLKASLINGMTTVGSISVTLSIDQANSQLSNLPLLPTFSPFVVIPGGQKYGQFQVSGSSNSDQPAILALSGVSQNPNFTVKGNRVRIVNQKLGLTMSVSDNFDGTNDFSVIDNIDKYPNNEVAIIDRWGVLVWLKKGYQNNRESGFTGQYNRGRSYDLPTGTYYYVIRIWDASGVFQGVFKGSLELRRPNSDN